MTIDKLGNLYVTWEDVIAFFNFQIPEEKNPGPQPRKKRQTGLPRRKDPLTVTARYGILCGFELKSTGVQ